MSAGGCAKRSAACRQARRVVLLARLPEDEGALLQAPGSADARGLRVELGEGLVEDLLRLLAARGPGDDHRALLELPQLLHRLVEHLGPGDPGTDLALLDQPGHVRHRLCGVAAGEREGLPHLLAGARGALRNLREAAAPLGEAARQRLLGRVRLEGARDQQAHRVRRDRHAREVLALLEVAQEATCIATRRRVDLELEDAPLLVHRHHEQARSAAGMRHGEIDEPGAGGVERGHHGLVDAVLYRRQRGDGLAPRRLGKLHPRRAQAMQDPAQGLAAGLRQARALQGRQGCEPQVRLVRPVERQLDAGLGLVLEHPLQQLLGARRIQLVEQDEGIAVGRPDHIGQGGQRRRGALQGFGQPDFSTHEDSALSALSEITQSRYA